MSSNLWKDAVDRSQNLLSPAEQEQYGKCKPNDILMDFQSSMLQQVHLNKFHVFCQQIDPLLAIIECLGRSMSITADMLSPIWVSIRIIFQITRGYRACFKQILALLQRIGQSLPRFLVYEHLFPKHEPIQIAILSIYIDVINLLTSVRAFSGKSTFRLVLCVLWKPLEQKFSECVSHISDQSELVEREANMAHLQEEARARAEVRRIQAKDSLDKANKWLNARQCHEARDSISVAQGTCEWILSRPEFCQWISDDSTRLLWIEGPPGCGKSTLYTRIVDYLKSRSERACTYFLFCGADRERVQLSALLRSWTSQLSKISGETREYFIETYSRSLNHQASKTEIEDLFFIFLDILPPLYLTFDAFDECIEREEFARVLQSIPQYHKILITARQCHYGKQASCGRSISLEINPAMTNEDIEQYILSETESMEREFEPRTVALIRNRLSMSNGMFLWVKLMVQHIKDQTTNEELMHCLSESKLPANLTEHYDRIMNTINQLPQSRRLLSHKILFWVDVARRPLRATELFHLLTILPSADREDGYRPSRYPSGDPEATILSVCGSLISLRGKSKVLYPIHFTVTEYIRHYFKNNNTLNELTVYYETLQISSANGLAAAVCLRYLSLDIPGKSERNSCGSSDQDTVSSGGIDMLVGYAGKYWHAHLEAADSQAEQPLPRLMAELSCEYQLLSD
ncbi:hypothetical protein V2G26_001437 [Clonostachys chloroleuca]